VHARGCGLVGWISRTGGCGHLRHRLPPASALSRRNRRAHRVRGAATASGFVAHSPGVGVPRVGVAAHPVVELAARGRPRRGLSGATSTPGDSAAPGARPMTTAPVEAASQTLVRGGHVVSADGTSITYLARGSGPVLLAVHGGLGSAVSMLPLAGHLAEHY